MMEARARAVRVLDEYLSAPSWAPGKGGPVRYMSEEIVDRFAKAGIELVAAPEVVVIGEEAGMTQLKVTTRTVQQIDALDLDAFVKEITGRDWEFAAAEAAGNDTDHAFKVSAEPLDQYSAGKMDGFLAGAAGNYPYPQIMLDWLAVEGHILPGDYLVRLSW